VATQRIREEEEGTGPPSLRIKEMEIHIDDQKSRVRTLEEERRTSTRDEATGEAVKHQLHDTLLVLEFEEMQAKLHAGEFSSEQQAGGATRFLDEARQQVEMRDDDKMRRKTAALGEQSGRAASEE
jgi:hypothetical protein